MMYEVWVRKWIHSGFAYSSDDVRLVKKLKLPFVPVIGMVFSEGDWLSGEIKELIWGINSKRFDAWVESDDDLSVASLHKREPERPLSNIVRDYEASGWEVEH